MEATGLQLHPPPLGAAQGLWSHQLSLLLESTGEGIFGIDLDGHCTFINRAGARMLGHDAAQVLGRNMHWLTHHSHADGSVYADTDCPIFNAFRQGLPCRIDTEVFWRADGSAFPVEYSSYPILDGADVRGAVITFVDITERRQSREALERANAALEVVNRALAQAKSGLEQRVEERTQALSAALAQQRELAAYSEQVREDERTRIAREVHDELGSLLVALKMDVNWLDKRLHEQPAHAGPDADALRERMRCKCQGMSRQIETAVDNVGRIITDLRPSILDHQGLWAALEWQAHEFVESAEIALDWNAPADGLSELPEPTAVPVFRIFQEMLSNVGRHAQATRVVVRLDASAGALRIAVRDNGRGAPASSFDAADAYGIMGMRERARHIGGRLAIDSAPGHGSTITLTLPSLVSPASLA